jgi:hypothetical protein
MNVRELIEKLSEFDPEVRVVLEYDSHFLNVRAVQTEVILLDGVSWADYPSVEALEENPLYPTPSAEMEANLASAQEMVVGIWGTTPW